MNLLLPKYLLEWIDQNKGEVSRQCFIVNLLIRFRQADQKSETTLDIDKWLDEIRNR